MSKPKKPDTKNQDVQNIDFVNSPFEKKITLDQINRLLSDVEGKLLTIADASTVDTRQCEATKSLIKQMIWRDFDIVREWYYTQTKNSGSNFPFVS